MKLLLDTPYLLPSIKVHNQGLAPTILKDLQTSLSVADIRIGIDSLQYNPRVKSLPWSMHPFLLDLALKLWKIHSDFVDCLILATAVFYTDCFVTFDETLYAKVSKESDLCKEKTQTNNKFQF